MFYYNENDPFAADWLEALIAADCIPAGHVDRRSIVEVTPSDVAGYVQAHFFAGIGGWPLAVRWTGLEQVAGLWSGSCPCQPFSVNGLKKGDADARHLWPTFFELISKCGPPVVVGEQVSGKLGLSWLGGVRRVMEGAGYALGAADLPAASVGAPHIRRRVWWVCWRASLHLAHTCGVALDKAEKSGRLLSPHDPWSGARGVRCRDGKIRRIKSGLSSVADGVSNRVGHLRCYGNAIIPQVAAVFLRSAWEAIADVQSP